ncbi:FG-GAP repeat domain-containing protein [Streptomyces reniochalinae]|uniref:VCBS repeat-containing protein n=1 Tax=Streptomyces reniochalinae TaxID=2250578 RepID=A0A367EJZ4_9ACTN|nr:VCBS repeat-containing protein [Streptomyces reniochalinae]RCG18032.1 VCBS repeat-containing protein [Streptomyces reniochalinae]
MRRTRSRWIALPLAAAALTLAGAGYATAVDPSPAGAAGGSARAASAPCLADSTTLVGDLDGDGRADRITNPGHTGTKMTVEWGDKDGSFGEKHTVRDLVGAKKGEDVAAAVADFDNDGKLDMVLNVIEPSGGDDPSTASLAEYRPGPLNRIDLTSPDAVHSDIGDHGEVEGLSVARYNDDDTPDLAVLNHIGDGMVHREARLSQPGGGLGDYDGVANGKYGESGTWGEPPAMPTDGWSQFFTSCA